MLKDFSSYWLLGLEPQYTGLVLQAAEGVVVLPRVVMNIGYESIAKQVFVHSTPRPVEVEEAIIRIEDEIMRVHKQVDATLPLVSSDEHVWEIARRARSSDKGVGIEVVLQRVLQRDEVEFLFNRWADIVSGSPVHASEQVMTKEFGAQLLILRELLHHFNFKEVLLVQKVSK